MKQKRLLSFVLAMLMLVIMLPTVALAAEPTPAEEFTYQTKTDGTIEITGLNDKTLTEVIIPEKINGVTVTSIRANAFYLCEKLTSVTIPSSVTSIGSLAFYGCGKLTSVTIPSGVTSIGKNAFYDCFTLTEIIVDSENQYYCSIDGVLFNKGKTEIIKMPQGKNVTEYTIPNSVTSIGDVAFYLCEKLTSVTIPSGVTSIGGSAFSNCSGLTSITIPGSVETIGDRAFVGCTKLSSVTFAMPSSVTSIGGSVFSGCIGLISMSVPNSVTSIGESAFSNCSGLTSITIPSGVTTIDSYAFERCANLNSIDVDGENQYYCSIDGVLFNKDKTQIIQMPSGKNVNTYSIPSSVTSIGSLAFYGCGKLTSITIPSSVASIGSTAFYGCSQLSNVYYLGTTAQWGNVNGNNNNIDTNKVKCIPVNYDKNVSLIYNGSEKKIYEHGDNNVTVSYYDESGTLLTSAPKNAGTYTVKVSGTATIPTDPTTTCTVSDLEIATFEITKATSFATPTTNAITYGDKLSEVSLPNGWTWENEDTVPTVTNSGYTAYYSPTDPNNYDWTKVDGWNASKKRVERTVAVTVNKATPMTRNFTFTASSNSTYDGTEKIATFSYAGNVNGMGMVSFKYYDESGTLLTSAPKNAGTYTVKIDVAEGTNYTSATDLTDTDWMFTIAPKSVMATIGKIADQTYMGSAIEPTVKAYDGETEIPTSEYEVEYTNNINAGTANIALKNKAGGNYIVSGSKNFTIKKLPVIIKWSDTTGWVYNGNFKTVTAEVANRCGTDEINLTISGDVKGKDKGTYNAEVTAVDNKNYTITDGENLKKQWAIEGTTNSFTTSLSIDGWTYGNTASTPTVTAKYGTPTYSYSAEENGTYTDAVPTNAGTYWVKATVLGTINYDEISIEPVSFTIAKATPTQSVVTSARLLKGKTLEEAIVTDGTVVGIDGVTPLNGTFEWVDKTKVMISDGSEPMVFIPTDENYNSVTVNAEVSVYTSGSSAGYTVKFYSNGGTGVASQKVARKETAAEPDAPTKSGYTFDGWYSNANLTSKYDFSSAVLGDVTLYAKWVSNGSTGNISSGGNSGNSGESGKTDTETKPENKPGNETTSQGWKNPFTDVKENDWFFESVKYANENGLMSGITSDTFAPNDTLTRGMLVTVLYRAEGEPEVNKSIPFADVNASQYYANAVIWAQQNGIVNGVTETEFVADENITREQIATIVYRYAEYKGVAPTGAWAIKLDYADTSEISDYAVEGVMYCTMKNIMQGKDNNMFAPKDFATRGEIAAILGRFIETNK